MKVIEKGPTLVSLDERGPGRVFDGKALLDAECGMGNAEWPAESRDESREPRGGGAEELRSRG